MERIKDLAAFGAKWWADQLRTVSPDKFDNGDTGDGSDFAKVLGMLIDHANHNETDYDEKVERFEELLKDRIEYELKYSGSVTLRVDYSPEYPLSEVVREAGLDTGLTGGLPWKTSMHISMEYGVEVSAGYCAPFEVLMK